MRQCGRMHGFGNYGLRLLSTAAWSATKAELLIFYFGKNIGK
jgi:hypothetical protein